MIMLLRDWPRPTQMTAVPLFVTLVLCGVIRAQMPNYCSRVEEGVPRATLDSLLATVHIPECCSSSLFSCLQNRQDVCPFSRRLENFACGMVVRETPFERMVSEMDARYQSLFNDTTYRIGPSPLPTAGDTNAPVELTVYVNASCPRCKEVVLPLYYIVAHDGALQGKAKLVVKPFSVSLGNRALVSAAAFGKFWAYFEALAGVKQRLDKRILLELAREVGIPVLAFTSLMNDEKIRKTLQKSYVEARQNSVRVTPTIFVNNRRYRSYKDPVWLVDAVETELLTMGPESEKRSSMEHEQ